MIYTLLADGGTDRVLEPIINWLVHDIDSGVEILEPEFDKRSGGVSDYLKADHPGPMIVFAHRDAENVSMDERLEEFRDVTDDRVVPVVPVRMTEAWLLIDSRAISRAAGNPWAEVELPPVKELNGLVNPKAVLEEKLLVAAGAPAGRRRKRFMRDIVSRRVNVADYTTDYSRLRELPDFRAFEKRLRERYPYRSVLT